MIDSVPIGHLTLNREGFPCFLRGLHITLFDLSDDVQQGFSLGSVVMVQMVTALLGLLFGDSLLKNRPSFGNDVVFSLCYLAKSELCTLLQVFENRDINLRYRCISAQSVAETANFFAERYSVLGEFFAVISFHVS
jgi:hypothetical protein